jgi:hypothetical protein
VDVGAAAPPVPVMTVRTWPLIRANVPQMRLVDGALPLGISARQNYGWRNRLVPTAARRASRADVEDHLRPVTGGTDDSRCRPLGSPQSSPEVPTKPQDEPPEPGKGTRDTAERSVFGGSGDLGVVAGNRGLVWPLEVPLRDAVAHRLRPVGISAQARSVTAGAGLAFHAPGRRIGRPPRASAPRAPSIRSRASSLRSSLRDP